jgi:hypothetical protein
MAIKHSRSARNFLERNGVYTTRRSPVMPRLDTTKVGLRVRTIPLDRSLLNPDLLLDNNGAPPTDRGKTDPWPPPQEVSDESTG